MAYIVPFLLALLILALIFHVDFLATVVVFLLALYILSRLWTRRAAKHLRIRRNFTERAFSGDEVRVDVGVRNTGRLPLPWLEVEESIPLDLRSGTFPVQVMSLGGMGEKHLTYDLVCRRRGYYQLGPLRAQTGDVLGVEQLRLRVEETRPFIVYPRIVPLEHLGLPTTSALVSLPSRTPLFEDPTRIMGVRDYQPGDSLRHMHWTATARAGHPLVKQFQPGIARETLICLDLDLRDYPAYRRSVAAENAIVVAASLAHHMIVREKLSAGLATAGEDPVFQGQRRVVIQPESRRATLMAILEILARIQPARTEGFVTLLREESMRVGWGATLVIITGQIDTPLAELLLYTKRRGHPLAVILVQPPDYRQDPLAGIPTHFVWTDQEMAAL